MTPILTALAPLASILVGMIAPRILEAMKNNPSVKFITPETTTIIRFIVAVLSFVTGITSAYLTGNAFDVVGGLNALVNAFMVFASAEYAYHAPGGVKESTATNAAAADSHINDVVNAALKTLLPGPDYQNQGE